MVNGICDPNKFRARHRCTLKLGSKLKHLNVLKNLAKFTKSTCAGASFQYSCRSKSGFPLGEMIWACASAFVYSSTGEIFLFKIVKMNLTNSRRKKSPQLLDQSKHILLALPVNTFSSDQSKDDCE